MSPVPSPQGAILHRLCPSCDIEVAEDRTSCATCGSKLVEIRAEVDTLVGTVVDGRFEIRAKLGQGGMGTVYRAGQKSVGREIAVKLIDRSFSRDAMAVRRFLREARLASQLSQPNTVSVFDFGQVEDGRLFIAMELIRGQTLHQVVKATGAFSIERVVRIGVQICDALEAAHGLGIVHRDLKLENAIVLDHPPGRDLLKVLDFGLAKNIRDPGSRATESGIVVGTPRYMSPEASTHGVTGPAGDIYSLGVILGELATGRPMWTGDSLPELIAQKLDPANVIAGVPTPLRSVVERMVDPDADRRPTAEQTRVLLTGLSSSEPDAADTMLDSDPRATTNLRSQSSPPEPRRPVSPEPLDSAPTVTPLPTAPSPGQHGDRGVPRTAAPSTAVVEPHRPAGRRWPLLAVSGAAMAAVTILIALLVRKRDDDPSSRAKTPSDAAPVALARIDAGLPVASPDAAPAAGPAIVTIRIETEPTGAMVSYLGRSQTAPFDLITERSGKPIELRAALAGRQTRKSTVVPDRNKPHVIKLPARATSTSDEQVPF